MQARPLHTAWTVTSTTRARDIIVRCVRNRGNRVPFEARTFGVDKGLPRQGR